jgi:hypothetical protein
LKDSAISRAEQHLATVGDPESPVRAEVTELVARHTHITGGYRDEATAHDRFITDMVRRSRDRDRSRSRDDGLEL